MIVFTYTALKELVSGHVAGNQYQIQFALRSHLKSNAYKGTQNFTDDDADTTIYSSWLEHEIESKMLDESEMLEVKEFLNSVNASEPFTFDFDATIGSPNNPKSGIKLFQERIRPTQPRPLFYRFKFEFREYVA